MNRKRLIDTIKNKLIKLQYEGSLEPYTKPPLTPAEKSIPIGELMRKRPGQPGVAGSPRPIQDDAAKLIQQPAEPVVVEDADVVMVQKYYNEYLAHLKMLYDNIARELGREPSRDTMADEFEEFKMRLVNNLRLEKNITQRKAKTDAIKKLQDNFRAQGASIFKDFDIAGLRPPAQPVATQPKKKIFTEDQVLAQLRVNAKLLRQQGQPNETAEANALKTLKELPQYKDVPENMEILDKLEAKGYGRHSKLSPLSISDEDRVKLVAIFQSSYLDKQKSDENKVQARYEQLGKAATDYFDFIGNRLFSADAKNKELFLRFWLSRAPNIKTRLYAMADKALQDYSEEDIAKDFARKQWDFFISAKPQSDDPAYFSLMQHTDSPNKVIINDDGDTTNIFVEELKKIMQNPNDNLHEAFFKFVLAQIYAEGDKYTMQDGKPETEEILGEEQKITSDLGKEKAVDQKIIDKAVQQSTLNSCKDLEKLKMNSVAQAKHFECLEEDWSTITRYMELLNEGLMRKYQGAQDVDSKINCLTKKVLWNKIYATLQETVDEVLQNKKREKAPLTDDMLIKILNRQWYDFYDAKRIAGVSFDKDDSLIAEICEIAANDLNMDYDDAFDKIMPISLRGYTPQEVLLAEYRAEAERKYQKDSKLQNLIQKYGITSNAVIEHLNKDPEVYSRVGKKREKNEVILNRLQQEAARNLHKYEDVLISAEIISEIGGQAPLTFIELIKIESEYASLGFLMARNNFQSYQDKLDYLDEVMRRPAESKIIEPKVQINVTREMLEKLTPTELDAIFGTIREMLLLLYSPKAPMQKILGSDESMITDADIAHLANMAGISDVTTKAKYRSIPSTKQKLIRDQFVPSEIGKFYLEGIRNYKAFLAWYAKSIYTAYSEKTYQQFGFADAESFLADLEIDPQVVAGAGGKKAHEAILPIITDFPRRKNIANCHKYFPLLYQTYMQRRLRKTDIPKDESSLDIISKLLQKFIDEGFDMPKGEETFSDTTADAVFFGKVLDIAGNLPVKRK